MPRKQHDIHYIYKTICNVTGKYYIGMHSTSNLEDGYMGSGKKLRYSLRKYGKENHTKEILEFFDTREELVEAEKRMITEEHLKNALCMNLMSGGTGGFTLEIVKMGRKRTDEILTEKYGENFRSILSKKFHASLSIEQKKELNEKIKIGQLNCDFNFKTFLNKKHSEETKRKMSESNVGKRIGINSSQYDTCWITKNTENKKIKKKDLQMWLSNGWIKGRKII